MSKMPSDLIDALCRAPDSQIDASVREALRLLKDKTYDEAKADLLDVICGCVDYSLCSGFALRILQEILYVKYCGGRIEDCIGYVRSAPMCMGGDA